MSIAVNLGPRICSEIRDKFYNFFSIKNNKTDSTIKKAIKLPICALSAAPISVASGVCAGENLWSVGKNILKGDMKQMVKHLAALAVDSGLVWSVWTYSWPAVLTAATVDLAANYLLPQNFYTKFLGETVDQKIIRLQKELNATQKELLELQQQQPDLQLQTDALNARVADLEDQLTNAERARDVAIGALHAGVDQAREEGEEIGNRVIARIVGFLKGRQLGIEEERAESAENLRRARARQERELRNLGIDLNAGVQTRHQKRKNSILSSSSHR